MAAPLSPLNLRLVPSVVSTLEDELDRLRSVELSELSNGFVLPQKLADSLSEFPRLCLFRQTRQPMPIGSSLWPAFQQPPS